MLPRMLKVAMLVCMVTVLLGAVSLKTTEAKSNTSLSKKVAQGHYHLNPDGRWSSVTGSNAGKSSLPGNAWNAQPRGHGPRPHASPNVGAFDFLTGVAAISASDVWAVGYSQNSSGSLLTLIIHWDGSQWSVVASPNAGPNYNMLNGVVAVSSSDVWAVGNYQNNNSPAQTLIEHWDGKNWSVVASPSPGSNFSNLNGVAAVSSSDVWAVGYDVNNIGLAQDLIEHWNGKTWTVAPGANPNYNPILIGVAAVTASDVWAGGSYQNSSGVTLTLVEHWNGKKWNVVTSPNVSTQSNVFISLAVVTASDIWAVGSYSNALTFGQVTSTLIEHWNGTKWSVVTSPKLAASFSSLNGVAAISTSEVWAVGNYQNSNGNQKTLIEQWDGKKWSVIPSPNASAYNNLAGVAAVSASDVWAVGNTGLYGSKTLAEQWNGSQWSIVLSPDPGSDYSLLTAVAAVSASNVWAVGSYDNGNGVDQTLIEQWNGSQWSKVTSSNPGQSSNFLNGVAAVSSSDVWAVGDYVDSNGNEQTLIEQWNGAQWSVVTSPNPGPTINELYGVAALSANDVWAVGDYTNNSGMQQTLIEQWNGTQWSVVTSPNGGSAGNFLSGVTVVSASDAWAVGNYSNGGGGLPFSFALVEHWNGTQWSVVTSPDPGSLANFLAGVSATSANDIWAVGSYDLTSGPPSLNLIEHWNGKKWSVVTSLNPGTLNNLLNGVVTISANDVWTVGVYNNFNGNGPFQTLTEHWNGKKWSTVTSPSPGALDNALNGVAAVSTSDVWAAGDYLSSAPSQTLTENWNGNKWSVIPSPDVRSRLASRN